MHITSNSDGQSDVLNVLVYFSTVQENESINFITNHVPNIKKQILLFVRQLLRILIKPSSLNPRTVGLCSGSGAHFPYVLGCAISGYVAVHSNIIIHTGPLSVCASLCVSTFLYASWRYIFTSYFPQVVYDLKHEPWCCL